MYETEVMGMVKKITDFKELKDKRCDVIGIGISNLPLLYMLSEVGARITARDKKTREELSELCDKLEAIGVSLVLGEGYLDGIDTDVIFRSPGVRPDLGSIPDAQKNGALLTSEMELFISLTKANLIAITGSDGKTTTTTLTHLFLSSQLEKSCMGKAYVGGNIGTPLLSEHSKMSERDYAVLELSSFQLMTLKSPIGRAAITNITPNHLDWHRNDMGEYISAKCNIFDDDTLLVLNAENKITKEIAEKRGSNMILFSSESSDFGEIVTPKMKNTSAIFVRNGYIILSDGSAEVPLLKVSDIKLPGKHNLENYMTAIALTYPLVDKEIYTSVAKSFGGVPHRLELVRELDGVRYYNSSIDSSPTRTAAALSAINETKVVICGGYDKNIPFEPLANALCENDIRAVVLTGATAKKIKSAILKCDKYSPERFDIIECESFDDAVLAAKNAANEGDCVLLSPASASFDRFKNFEARGEYFKSLVNSF